MSVLAGQRTLNRATGIQIGGSRMRPWMVRVGCALLVVGFALSPLSVTVLGLLVPAQRVVYEALMPEHRVETFALQADGAQLVLAVRSRTTVHIVVRGQVYPSGIEFAASTPARTSLLYAALIIAGVMLTLRGSWRRALPRGVLALVAAISMAIATPSVILAGAEWGLALHAFEEPSLAALLVAVADFLLHGGAYALCAAAVWLLRSRSEMLEARLAV